MVQLLQTILRPQLSDGVIRRAQDVGQAPRRHHRIDQLHRAGHDLDNRLDAGFFGELLQRAGTDVVWPGKDNELFVYGMLTSWQRYSSSTLVLAGSQ